MTRERSSRPGDDDERKGRLRAEALLRESEQQFHMLAESIPQLAWMAHPNGWIFWYNRRWYDYTGTTLEQMEGWGWRSVHHPDHIDRVVARVQRSWETGSPWEDTFPLRRADGAWRWFLSRALPVRDDDGHVVRWFGTNTDITEIREAEERQKKLLDELNHRVKNTLAVVQSVTGQTLRTAPSAADLETALNTRLLALSRSHDLLSREHWQGADLEELIRETVLPQVPDGDASRLAIGGPAVRLGSAAAVTLGMVFHELAANAIRHGAFSVDVGRIAVEWRLDFRGGETPAVEITWTESGGPEIKSPPQRRGLGARLIEGGLTHEFGAEVKLEFPARGFRCWMRLPLSSKVASAGSPP